jgi:catechol 2,3-dioxygenase-like lactoylglutathione lyase family enzyme
MIQRQSHTTVYVLNQDEALGFYRDILGLEVRTDMTLESGFRWLSVGPKAQPDLEIVLMEVKAGPSLSSDTAQQLKSLVEKGAFGIGVFATDDCQRDFEEWSKKGVTFMQPPKEQFYGLEALVKDNSGNWFSLTQQKR